MFVWLFCVGRLTVFGLGWFSVSCLPTHHPRLANDHNYGACRITEESLEPLHAKPSKVDEAIAVQVAKINVTKAATISFDRDAGGAMTMAWFWLSGA